MSNNTIVQEKIDQALQEVRELIVGIVREEQSHDNLTGLANDFALTDELASRVEGEGRFWVAFVEVDHFKRLNDRFGYESADSMLIKIAEQLRQGAENYFAEPVRAFRAHGDEFWLVGDGGHPAEEEVLPGLETLCSTISALRIKVDHRSEHMRATVSVGWAIYPLPDSTFTPREIRFHLEAAVSAAKHQGRDCVVRYTTNLKRHQTISVRDKCSNCKTSFSADIPIGATREGDLSCPNCGNSMPRPADTVPSTPPREEI